MWEVRYSAEVAKWIESLTDAGFAEMDAAVKRLEVLGNLARMPLSRSLGDGLFELRFDCEGVARRITYIFQPEKQIITLTTFRKQRQVEAKEIQRARKVQADYLATVPKNKKGRK